MRAMEQIIESRIAIAAALPEPEKNGGECLSMSSWRLFRSTSMHSNYKNSNTPSDQNKWPSQSKKRPAGNVMAQISSMGAARAVRLISSYTRGPRAGSVATTKMNWLGRANATLTCVKCASDGSPTARKLARIWARNLMYDVSTRDTNYLASTRNMSPRTP